jgi:predicted molibdopterin-dependent oxidoreductase YjgC
MVNPALLTGNIGKPGCGLSPLRGQNNVQGVGDMGALPNLLAGHMEVDDEAARIHVGAIWGAEVPSQRGLAENDTVRMTSPHGTVLLPLKLEASMQRGYLFAPIHYSEPNFNSLMSAVPIDTKARMPTLKVVPVRVKLSK